MTRGVPLRSVLASIVFVFAIAVAGCAQQQTDYDPDIADRLQGEVLEVSQLSANADFASALLALDELEVELKDARARGLLTDERYESIMAALALVRADLEAAIAAQMPPAPAPEPEGGDGGGEGGDGGGEGEDGKGNDDKGNDDKGKGNKDD